MGFVAGPGGAGGGILFKFSDNAPSPSEKLRFPGNIFGTENPKGVGKMFNY